VVELPLDLSSLPRVRDAVPSDPDARNIQVVQVNVKYVIHFYKRVIGNMMLKMLVISRTQTCIERHAYTALAAQRDSLGPDALASAYDRGELHAVLRHRSSAD
jgi:hypothetical protein